MPVSGPGANPAIKAKPPTNIKENNKPAVAPAAPPASTPKSVDTKPSGAAETTITLTMRQATQEAAQKAKDLKKKATEVLINTTKPEPAIVPTATMPDRRHTFETITILQNPDNSTWSAAPLS